MFTRYMNSLRVLTLVQAKCTFVNVVREEEEEEKEELEEGETKFYRRC